MSGGLIRAGGASHFEPALPAAKMQTYAISAPLATHWRPATCEEADCGAYLHGWQSFIDESTELGQRQAHYIRRESRRRFTEERNEAGITEFTFEAGQRCFKSDQHRVRNYRDERYLVRGGDFRGNPTGMRRVHKNAAEWQEDFQGHQDRLATALERG
jgi:hypothetical protein